jgi:hypothetical protein
VLQALPLFKFFPLSGTAHGVKNIIVGQYGTGVQFLKIKSWACSIIGNASNSERDLRITAIP